MVYDEAFDRELFCFHIEGRQDGSVNGTEAGGADDEGRQVQPVNDVF